MSLTLSKINIQNYKSIDDIVLDVEKYDDSYTTVFVGKNETGKSNLLDAISFIKKPETTFRFEDLKNSQNEENEYIDFYFSYKFDSEEEWQDILNKRVIAPAEFIEKIRVIALVQNIYLKEGKTTFLLDEYVEYNDIPESFLKKYSFKKITNANSTENDALYEIVLSGQDSTTGPLVQNHLSKEILSNILIEIYRDVLNKSVPTVSKWKYSNEYLITETIDLNQFKANTNICYPLKNIFNLAGFKTKEDILTKINTLTGSPKNINKLEKQLENTATAYINKVWKESKIKIKIKIQNDLKLALYVTDEADDENTYYMSDRSEGFKQFVSLILSISAANETDDLKNNIILIDEPEVHMHPSGIRFMKNELLRIGKNNYVFLATHSQFMIDTKNQERHYIVTKPKSNTLVKVWNSTISFSDDEILRQAFGINVLNDLLAKNRILVEGYSDYQLLSKTLNILSENHCITLTNGTGSNILAVASMLKMYNVPVLTIVDADTVGEKYKKDIIKLGEPFSEMSVKTIRDLNDEIVAKGTIEDALNVDFVIRCLNSAYSEILQKEDFSFSVSEEKPIIEEYRIALTKAKIQKDIIERIIESAKCKIAEKFTPNKTNLEKKHPKLLEIANKIINYFEG